MTIAERGLMTTQRIPATVERNIETIASLEQDLLSKQSIVDRVGIAIASFFGSAWFIGAHILFFSFWILLNSSAQFEGVAFDPYPFPFLALVVGVEFFFLTTFVLRNQRVHSRRQEQWAHLNLQLCMLAEQEVTKNIQLLDLIRKRLEIPMTQSDEIQELAKRTPVDELLAESTKILAESP